MIPDEAVEAAARAAHDELCRGYHGPSAKDPCYDFKDEARTILDAAAPHLMAEAWDEGYEKGLVGAVRIDSSPDANPYRKLPNA